ncbi:hypothetical protein AYM40_15570 [Paraburkholderia phytofirmans OLGA172]|uniref:UvrD-like helicase C-terminal domain-containing protein n=1 Tax=Paraburkholderia phytofirmans OLGA172 TaxID=1417228 RepID=A0A167W2K6_9BURK|nr:hypothetical protein [Paraburkholderia phytofirmans]ANB73617.1 hypothetical protein AYM40_15570 [Paraburkholderia phytofirmans OLGA172]
MPTEEAYPLSEERRLFDVALTRARRGAALFTVKGASSPLLDKLVQDKAVKVKTTGGDLIEEERCSACESATTTSFRNSCLLRASLLQVHHGIWVKQPSSMCSRPCSRMLSLLSVSASVGF